jgi:GNAT superfamily N-acetyltransferase
MLARAFSDDPLFTHFFPDPSEKSKKSLSFFHLLVRYGILYGEADATSPALEGIAIWLPFDKAGISNWGMIHSGALTMAFRVGAMAVGRLLRFSKHANAVHKCHAPFRHRILQSIGVDPLLQGKGYASVLLKAKLERLDREGVPCYLDTQTEKNVIIYEHYGFKVVEEFRIPGTHFSNWAMLRKPHY